MLSATLEAGLSDSAIGPKIRALRLKKIAFLDDHHTSCRFGSTPEEFARRRGEIIRTTDGLEIV